MVECLKCTNNSLLPQNRYYICLGGERNEFTCHSGLHWDPVNQWCTTPLDAGCDIDHVPIVDCPVNATEPVFLPHPDPEQCALYFICIRGNAYPECE